MATNFGSALLSGFNTAFNTRDPRAQNRLALDQSLYREAATQGMNLQNEARQRDIDQFDARKLYDELRGSPAGKYITYGDDGNVIGIDTQGLIDSGNLEQIAPLLQRISTFGKTNKGGQLADVTPLRIKPVNQTTMVTPESAADTATAVGQNLYMTANEGEELTFKGTQSNPVPGASDEEIMKNAAEFIKAGYAPGGVKRRLVERTLKERHGIDMTDADGKLRPGGEILSEYVDAIKQRNFGANPAPAIGEVQGRRLDPLPEPKETGETVYAIEVRNADGSIGVITQNASDDPNDQVQGFTKDQLNGLLDTAFNKLAVDAGIRLGDARDFEAAGRAQRTAALTDLADRMTLVNNDPAMGRQFLQSIQNLDAEEQDEILAEAGFDVSQFRTAPTPEASSEESKDAGTTTSTSDLSAVAAAKQSLDDLRAEIPRSRRGMKPQDRQLVNTAKEDLDQALEALPEIQEMRSGLEGIPRNKAGNTKRARVLADIRKKKTELIETAIKGDAPSDASAPAEPGAELTNNAGATIPVNRQAVESALRSNDLKLTDQQRTYIRNRMEQQGIRTLRQAGRLPEDDQIRIAAFIAASDLGGSTNNRLSAFYSALNGMQTGDPDSTPLERQKVANAKAKNEMDLRNWTDKLRGQYGDGADDVIQRQTDQTIALFDDDFEFKDSGEINITDSAIAVNAILQKAKVPGARGAAARENQTNLLYNHLAGVAAKNGPDTFMQWLGSFFRSDTGGVIGGLEGRIFMRRDSQGIAQTVVFTDSNGSIRNYELPWITASNTLSPAIRSEAERLIPDLPARGN